VEGSQDRTFEAFKRLVPHLRGSLWWGRNDLIKRNEPTFNQNDAKIGHPLLSLRNEELKSRRDAVPMLVGTSGNKMCAHNKRRCIEVAGMERATPRRITYFGSIVEPALYGVDEMIDGVSAKKGERTVVPAPDALAKGRAAGMLRVRPWSGYHRMIPNRDKPVVDARERAMIEDYCLIHQL